MSRALQRLYQDRSYEDEAGQRAVQTLLNCYCREVAGPEGQVSIGSLFGKNDWPMALRAVMYQGQVMRILMPRINTRFLLVMKNSLTGNHRYSNTAYFKAPGRSWAYLDWEKLATLLLNDLSLKYEQPFNHELIAQIHESVAVTRTFLTCPEVPPPRDPLQAFLHSEQSLRFGHPFHPAPKSRQGFTTEDVTAYSPEMRVGFQLHYFSVRREYLLQSSTLDTSCDELIHLDSAVLPLALKTEFALLPVHPWQANYLLQQPLVKTALAQGKLRDHGVQGDIYYPTSSIRTLYHPDKDYFYKCSLNVRITNCVRKNALYELDGALRITEIMRDLLPELTRCFPGLHIMEEPAYQSIDLCGKDEQQNRLVTEGFGLILRQGINQILDEGVTPLLAGALFGNTGIGTRWVERLLLEHGSKQGLSRHAATESWFAAYVEQLMLPILYCFFKHGVIFEPHLQNVLIGLVDGCPNQLFLRDFEGVKLQRDCFEDRLSAETEQVREALCYSEEKGWKRIAYCLFVNNFCEAITQLANSDSKLEAQLWAVVREKLEGYQRQYGNEVSAHYIDALLAGESFPAKANLINRFFKRADREVIYIPLHNPLNNSGEDTV